ncbi:hypothetical protein [Kordia sp.]|uniref:hypothetical protein n=1 Tax=Kordia sp. TaxID=1965332 RepID=UPI0025C4D5DC|nr:hypothetical protein [Kordia sp.]MCH2197105.1 hypothetical protein [Kordia sp.]
MKKVLFASVLLLGILMFNSCTDQTDLTEEQQFEYELQTVDPKDDGTIDDEDYREE